MERIEKMSARWEEGGKEGVREKGEREKKREI